MVNLTMMRNAEKEFLKTLSQLQEQQARVNHKLDTITLPGRRVSAIYMKLFETAEQVCVIQPNLFVLNFKIQSQLKSIANG